MNALNLLNGQDSGNAWSEEALKKGHTIISSNLKLHIPIKQKKPEFQ